MNQNKKTKPPEIIREIIENNGDLSGRKFQQEKYLSLGAMKYLPNAIYKLLENIPSPWETNKKVKVAYHKKGVLSLVGEIPKRNELVYKALWSVVWTLN